MYTPILSNSNPAGWITAIVILSIFMFIIVVAVAVNGYSDWKEREEDRKIQHEAYMIERERKQKEEAEQRKKDQEEAIYRALKRLKEEESKND